MKIFISYSTSDKAIVTELANKLQIFGDVLFWDQNKIPGQESWPTIFNWIETADIVIVLITGNTLIRAMSVGQEVGRARTLNKTIVPIVSDNIPQSELGCLAGLTYQPIDIYNPDSAISELNKVLQSYQNNIQEKQKAFVGVLILGIAIWLGSK